MSDLRASLAMLKKTYVAMQRSIAKEDPMKLGRLIPGLVAGVMAVTLTACSSGNQSDSAGGSDSYEIGLVTFSSSDRTTQLAYDEYTKYAESKGWEVSQVDSGGSVDNAIGAMNNYVQKNVDLIIVAVYPSTSLTAGLSATRAAGIPVISIAGGTAPGAVLSADAGAPNAVEGAKALVENSKGQGELLLLGYSSGLPCLGREEGLKKELKGTEINVTRKEFPIPGQEEAGSRLTAGWLSSHPKGSDESLSIWACADEATDGVIAALRAAGRTDVEVYSINGSPPELKAVKSGEIAGESWVDSGSAGTILAKKTPAVIEAGPDAKPVSIPIPSILVTPENYEEFAKSHPDALK